MLGFPEIDVPQPVNLFESNAIGPDGSLGIEPAPSQAGDSVTLRAELDCIVCVTACPQDLTPPCGWAPTAVAAEITDDERTHLR